MKVSSLKLNDKVEVRWLDIVADSRWLDYDDAKTMPATVCSTVGYFCNISDGCLRLSCSINEDGQRDLVIIPVGTIYKISRLK